MKTELPPEKHAEPSGGLPRLASDFEFFVHITSHDLRDPLRQARIYSNELLADLTIKQQQKLQSINSCIDEVLEKIAILRDFSYVALNKAGQSPVNLDNITDDAIKELDSTIKSTGTSVTKHKLPINITGNSAQLRRLIISLLQNAIKFRSNDRKPQITISASEQKEFWCISIEDNGVGLDNVYRDLVFVLFQKLDMAKGTKDGSYGAGLAFAKKIVENHGGKIWYESDAESGTKFHFTIKK